MDNNKHGFEVGGVTLFGRRAVASNILAPLSGIWVSDLSIPIFLDYHINLDFISMPERGVVLLQRAEALYAQGKSEKTFELYQQAIKKILKDEDVAALLPAIVPDDTPKETLGFLWRNFAGFFKDPAMKFATGMPTFVARVPTQTVAF